MAKITLPTINTNYNQTNNQINISTPTKGYNLALDLNGQTVFFGGEEISTNWTLSVQPGDVVDAFVFGPKGSKSINYTISSDGVIAEAERGLYHNLIGGAIEAPIAQVEEQVAGFWAMLPSRQEALAQIELVEEEQAVPAQTEIDNTNRVLDFGVNEGKKLSECSERYLKWAASHASVFGADHKWVAVAAKVILEARQPQQEQKAA